MRGISKWHQKSEYETRRKLHDVIIVLWECLEWSEYHNTGVAHYGNYCYRFYYCMCFLPDRQLPRSFHLSPRSRNFFECVPFCWTHSLFRGHHFRSFSSPLSVDFLRNITFVRFLAISATLSQLVSL